MDPERRREMKSKAISHLLTQTEGKEGTKRKPSLKIVKCFYIYIITLSYIIKNIYFIKKKIYYFKPIKNFGSCANSETSDLGLVTNEWELKELSWVGSMHTN